MTASMKLKRRVITERYAALIDALYADEATAQRQHKERTNPGPVLCSPGRACPHKCKPRKNGAPQRPTASKAPKRNDRVDVEPPGI